MTARRDKTQMMLGAAHIKTSRDMLSDEALRARLQECQHQFPTAASAIQRELAHRQQKDQRHAAPRT